MIITNDFYFKKEIISIYKNLFLEYNQEKRRKGEKYE